jgi:hypothetical protein
MARARPLRRKQPCGSTGSTADPGVAIRRCGWCGKTLGIAPNVFEGETTGICELCEVRFECEAALAHALVGLRAITEELERARAGIWPPPPTEEEK